MFIYGGSHDDYDIPSNCTKIGHFSSNERQLVCKDGRLIFESFYQGHFTNPDPTGLLVKANVNGVLMEYINVIDLKNLIEIKRFDVPEPLSSLKDVIYIE